MSDYATLLSYVATSASEAEVRGLFEVANQRLKTLRTTTAAENLASLQKDQTVRLQGLKPKYLNGLTGTVQGIEGNRVRVKLDDVSAITAKRYVNFDHTLLAPASAVTLIN